MNADRTYRMHWIAMAVIVLLVSGRTVQVMYDYAEGASKSVPREVRDALEAFEGPFGRRGYPEIPGTGDL